MVVCVMAQRCSITAGGQQHSADIHLLRVQVSIQSRRTLLRHFGKHQPDYKKNVVSLKTAIKNVYYLS
jgi:hypothetical protein